MTIRRVGGVDLDTGEMLAGVPVWVGPKIRSPYGRRFYMSSQDALEALAKDPEMTGQAYRVFLYLCSRLDFENFIQVPQTEIADELQIGRNKVSEAVSLLVAKGILLRGPKVARSSVFRLNPTFGWKGKVKSLNSARSERLKVVKGSGPVSSDAG
jgi:hypothetical protein